MSFCIQCGKPIGKGDRFCPGCGGETASAQTHSTTPTHSHSRALPPIAEPHKSAFTGNRWISLALGLAGLGFVGLIAIVFLSTQSKPISGSASISNQTPPVILTETVAEISRGISQTKVAVTPTTVNPPSPTATESNLPEAMAAANDFYAWYLDKWIEPSLEPDWYEKSEKLTPAFREAWRKLQVQAEQNGEGLDYDPVIHALEIPPGSFQAIHGEPGTDPSTVRVIMLATGWDFTLDVRMRKNQQSGTWQIDAIQDLNQNLETLKPVEIPAKARCQAVTEAFLATLRSGMVDRSWWLLSSRHREQLPSGEFREFLEGMGMLEKNRTAAIKPWDPGDGSIGMEATLKAPGKTDKFIVFLFTEDKSNGWLIDSFVVPSVEPPASANKQSNAKAAVSIAEVEMGFSRDPKTGRITDEDYVFASEGEAIHLTTVIRNAQSGQKLRLTVEPVRSDKILIDQTFVIGESTSGEWLFSIELPRPDEVWKEGNYKLFIQVANTAREDVVFGIR